MEDYDVQKKNMNQMHKNRLIIKRRLEFNERYPDIVEHINNQDYEFSHLPILIPYEKYKLIESLIYDLRVIYKEYIDTGKCRKYDNLFETFELKKAALDKAIISAKEFVNEHINDKLICKRREIDWLLATNRETLFRQIAENDGKYTKASLKLMTSPGLIKEYINLFSSRNKSALSLERYNEDQHCLIFYTKEIFTPSISLKINVSDFMKEIGSECIYNIPFTYSTKDIVKIGRIINNERNLNSVILITNGFANALGCVFLIDDLSTGFYIYRKKDKYIRHIKRMNYLQSFTSCLALGIDGIERHVNALINKKDAYWVSPKGQVKLGIDEEVKKLYDDYKIYDDIF